MRNYRENKLIIIVIQINETVYHDICPAEIREKIKKFDSKNEQKPKWNIWMYDFNRKCWDIFCILYICDIELHKGKYDDSVKNTNIDTEILMYTNRIEARENLRR